MKDHLNEILQIKSSFQAAAAAILTSPRLSEIPLSGDLMQTTEVGMGNGEGQQMSSMEESTRGAFRALHDLAQIYYSRSADEEALRGILIPLTHFGGQSLVKSCFRCIFLLFDCVDDSHLGR